MGACSIHGSDEETDTVGALGGVACLDLGLLLDFSNKAFSWVLRAMSVPVSETFVAHELGKVASISSHARNDDSHMFIDFEDFFLMEGQIVRAFFQSDHYLQNKWVRLIISWLSNVFRLIIVLLTT